MQEFNCDWLRPCPICKRCMNLAVSLYERCQKCGFSHIKCNHTEEQRDFMIKRNNFKLDLPESVLDIIKKLGEE